MLRYLKGIFSHNLNGNSSLPDNWEDRSFFRHSFFFVSLKYRKKRANSVCINWHAFHCINYVWLKMIYTINAIVIYAPPGMITWFNELIEWLLRGWCIIFMHCNIVVIVVCQTTNEKFDMRRDSHLIVHFFRIKRETNCKRLLIEFCNNFFSYVLLLMFSTPVSSTSVPFIIFYQITHSAFS